MTRDIQLLDCTLRDGGFGLEDYGKMDPLETGITESDVIRMIQLFSNSNIDIVELGSIEITGKDMRKYCIYSSIEEISKMMPQKRPPNQLYAAMFRGPDTPLKDIPNWTPEFCQIIRVIIRYSELDKSLLFCRGLAEKGYKVSVQPMLTTRYSENELDKLIAESNKMGAYALYFVDSYGYMNSRDINYYFERFNKGLHKGIKIGFHAHNNMNLAYANAICLANQTCDRGVVIDCCATGMGQGAGNLQTELIAPFLNEMTEKNYSMDSILNICEIVDKYTVIGKWGYSTVRMISALNKTAYKYALALRNQYGMNYVDIYRVLHEIPDEFRQRYTPENTIKILKHAGYDKYIL